MKRVSGALALVGSWIVSAMASAHAPAAVNIEVVGPDGRTFREFPLDSRDDALRSYLQAEKGARYQVRIRNTTGARLGLVIAVDGRNIINGKKSDLARTEPMYVLDAWDTQEYAGWRASLDAINEFYFTDWSDSYAQAFGDRAARGVIAVAVYREVPAPQPTPEPYSENDSRRSDDAASAAGAAPAVGGARAAEKSAHRDESAGTGYGERRADRAYEVEFTAQSNVDSRHFIKYEWRETLCRKQIVVCGEQNRFWDEGQLGFAPPPPRRARYD